MTKKNCRAHLYNALNERVKYKYAQHLRRALKKDEKTIVGVLQHIRLFEDYINFSGFQTYNAAVADKFIRELFDRDLSLSFISNNIRSLKEFLKWLERQPGYRSKIDYNHIDYLNISQNQRRAAKAPEYQKSYKYQEIFDTIRKMPDQTPKEKRDKALVSLQALCALRISELRTVKIKNLIEEDGVYLIYVTPKNMSVKFGKTRQAVFLSLPSDFIQNVISWRDYLLSIGFRESDPLFPKIDNRFTQANFLEQNVRAEGIKSNTTIINIFRKAFTHAGYEYIRPHNIRKTLVRFAQFKLPAFFNACKENLGHNKISITLSSYCQLSEDEQRQYISSVKIEDEVD